ncbi:hypothetical protein [Rhodanobacter sp. C03]|uniref:hypothetical protein n=1 Tax=Rhodanobacter sp. C03 TaxID=1945858 RepID=UPI0020C2313D|nr:hypothetical protein [Rhodanobacter sp. C03]
MLASHSVRSWRLRGMPAQPLALDLQALAAFISCCRKCMGDTAMRSIHPLFGCMLVLFGSMPVAAIGADAAAATHAPAALLAASKPAPPVQPAHMDSMGPSVAIGTLAKLTGGASVSEKMTLTGTVSNNHDDHVVTGLNDMSGNSFAGSAGLSTVIQNTGNNVLIQNATIVNVQFKP